MGFIDAYKHLEKLCGDMLHDDRRLSAYIDEMLRLSNGARYVRNWDYDLKQLKHYRWVRNQIVHEPGHTEQNMCVPEDTLWIENFYSRILNQTDPLAQYYKAIRSQRQVISTSQNYVHTTNIVGNKVSSERKTGKGLVFICILFVVAVMIFVLKMY